MSTTAVAAEPTRAGAFWPWIALACAVVWTVLLRWPIVLNAADHLDSDLAVDGLTLLEATRGQFRWHYPGTPYMGILPLFLSLPQALAWGASPITLVSGGGVAQVALVVATFLLARRAFGAETAAWSLVPLTFASTGVVWLSGRITGGHLLTTAWHAGAFAWLAEWLQKGGNGRAFWLGLWCGIGGYLDSMFLVTLAGLVPVALVGLIDRRAGKSAFVMVLAFVLGIWPKPVGAWVEPYDAYREQFTIVTQPDLLASHARLLGWECLPRLLAGHRLPDLQTDPEPSSLHGGTRSWTRPEFDILAMVAVVVSSIVTLAALAGLAMGLSAGPSTSRLIIGGLLLASAATLAGFVVNRNIFNSDNYRYLVGLLVPWSLGFGIAARKLSARGRTWRIGIVGFCLFFALVMTADVARWYARFGWIDGRGRPIRLAVDDPLLAWLNQHPDVGWLEGGYWDVYRLAFLTQGRVRGAPFPIYPNRFPEWSPRAGESRVTFVRPTAEGRLFLQKAVRDGARVLDRVRGTTVLIHRL